MGLLQALQLELVWVHYIQFDKILAQKNAAQMKDNDGTEFLVPFFPSDDHY